MIKVAVIGSSGRMGRALIEAMHVDSDTQLTATVVRQGSKLVGQDLGQLFGIGVTGVLAVDNILNVINDFDLVIDFTSPQSSMELLAICQEHQKKMVIGTTGFSKEQLLQIAYGANDIAIVSAPNMSLGINLCLNLLATTTKAIGANTDIEILDLHHNKKVDSPSGTAVQMGKVIAKAAGRKLDDCAVYKRHGIIGARGDKEIGFATVRAGDIVGEHTVFFAGNGERVEISHKASSRMTFAHGAVAAVKWLADKNTGLFDMQDVLGLADNMPHA
jgi:4-hydroxy-tetrahydrodipicolinate reductase